MQCDQKNRRQCITFLGGAAAAWPLAARAQQGGGLRRIGVLIALTESDSEGQLRVQAFRQALQQLGWVEGRNLHIEYRWPGANAERLRTSARELVGLRPDVMLAGNTTSLIALQQETSTLPIVFVQVADPAARGYVASLAHPGGNSTGFALYEQALAGKWVEVLSEVAPRTSHIGVVYDPLNVAQTYLPDIEKALSRGMQLLPYASHSRSEL